MNESVKLALLWARLDEIKKALDNEVIPISVYLKPDDEELMAKMEELSGAIGKHFQNFRLQASKTEMET